jgi:hypothetical protein
MVEQILTGKIAPLSQKSAAILQKLINPCAIEDPDFLNRWITKFHKYIHDNPKEIQNVFPYISAIFPLIQKDYAVGSDLLGNLYTAPDLREIAEKIAQYDPTLKQHMLRLESEFVQKEIRGITKFLKLYASYPFSKENREMLLKKVSAIDENKMSDWFMREHLLYKPLDQDQIEGLAELDLIDGYQVFRSEDRIAMLDFFQAGGIQKILLNCLNKKPPTHISQGFRWAIIAQDNQLFSLLYDICSSKNFPQEDLEDLARFKDHFNPLIPIQKKLASLFS